MAVDSLLGAISDALVAGRRVEIRGFGSFGTRVRAGKVARNPRTGKPVTVAEKTVPYFKPGAPLLAHLQPKSRNTLAQLIAECDRAASPPAMCNWDEFTPVGLELV